MSLSETIQFHSRGAALNGRLLTPQRTKAPGVVISGSWTTVKEQMPANYVPWLVEAGFVVLTFDFAGFGESEGQPRDVESPSGKAEDLRNAAAFLRGHPAVAGCSVGALTICASSGYVATTAGSGSPFASLAMVAPWLHDASIVNQVYGGQAAVDERLADAARAREKYARTGKVDYVPAASNSDPRAAMYWPGDALDYYLNPNRGAVSQWSGRFAVMAWQEWLSFDPIASAPHVNVPVRLITSEQSATPEGVRRFEDGLAVQHDSVWIEGTQFDFYDDPNTVHQAAELAIEHLKATLS